MGQEVETGMLMTKLCGRCAEGPSGMQGHEGLELLTRNRARPDDVGFTLACRDCGARWSRVFRPDGPAWTPVEA